MRFLELRCEKGSCYLSLVHVYREIAIYVRAADKSAGANKSCGRAADGPDAATAVKVS